MWQSLAYFNRNGLNGDEAPKIDFGHILHFIRFRNYPKHTTCRINHVTIFELDSNIRSQRATLHRFRQ